MSVAITTYTLASGLMQQGMAWWQAMLTILLGQHDRPRPDDPQRPRGHEVRCGIPGAVPRQLRRDAARTCPRCCARSWRAAGSASRRGSAALRCTRCWRRRGPRGQALPGGVWIAFGMFWLVQVAIIVRGLDGIKWLESWSAPLLIAGGALLLWWAARQGGGLGRILSESSRLQTTTSRSGSCFRRH